MLTYHPALFPSQHLTFYFMGFVVLSFPDVIAGIIPCATFPDWKVSAVVLWLDSSVFYIANISFHGWINILLYRCTSLSIHLLKTILAAPKFWEVRNSCYKHSWAGFCVDRGSQLLWENAKNTLPGLYAQTVSIPFSCPLPWVGRLEGDPTWKKMIPKNHRSCFCPKPKTILPGELLVFSYERGQYSGPQMPQNLNGKEGEVIGPHQSFKGSRKQEKLSCRSYLWLRESSVTGRGRAADKQPQSAECPWGKLTSSNHS